MVREDLTQKMSAWGIVLIVGVCVLFGSMAIRNNPYNLDWSRGELSHQIAYNLYRTGHMYAGTPFLARPPGYIHFVAFVFSAADQLTRLGDGVTSSTGAPPPKTILLKAVFIAQLLVHAASTVVLYLWAGRLMRRRIALLSALAFGTSIYWLVQITTVHYAVWHMFLVLAGGYLWTLAWVDRDNTGYSLLSGLVWGCATLVRPVTLLLPIFAVGAVTIAGRADRRWIARFSLLFILGMLLVIGPHTYKNFQRTGRLIPVNAQAGVAFWSGTQPHPGISPKTYFWATLFPDFERIYRDTTGQEYTFDGYIRHNLALEDEFKRQAWQNLRKDPGVYLTNTAVNLKDFTLGVDSAYLEQFLIRKKEQQGRHWPAGDRSAVARDILPYEGMILLLTLLTGLAAWVAVRTRDSLMLIPAAILICYGVGHALTLLDIHYYYFKQPFLYLGAGYAVSHLCYAQQQDQTIRRRLGFGLMAVVMGMTLVGWRLLF